MVWWGLAAVMLVAPPAAGDVLYVSPKGSDANPGTTAKPIATLERARDEARKRGPAAVRIVVRGGVYYMERALVLGPEDSGLVIEAAAGEEIVLAGGRPVNGWKPYRGAILRADLAGAGMPDLSFRELYLGGRRQPMARVPNFDPKHPRHGGWLLNAEVAEPGGNAKLRYRAGELQPEKWTHIERAVVVFHDSLNYENTWAALRSVDTATRTIAAGRGVYELKPGNPYYVCGLLEELDAPGEWYVDPEAKAVYFWPPAGKPGRDQVVVPALESVFVLQGEAEKGRWVEKVRIAGLEIRDCRGKAVNMSGARGCTVAACDLRNVGVGVYLGDDTHDCRVAGCDITQTLGDGVSVWGTSLDHTRVSGHVIDNNYIYDYGWGQIHNRCGGVFMVRCAGCKVTHNHVHDGPRYAIGMDTGNDCEIAWNYCHHVNLETLDTGIIEAATAWDWGRPDETERNRLYNRGNSIHHNLLHDSGGWGTGGDGQLTYPAYSWGIYLDTHCSGWAIHDNVIYNTVLGAYMVNGGQDNVFENNVCVDGKVDQAFLEPWPKYMMSGNRVERNIFAYGGRGANLYNLPSFKAEYVRFGANLIWAGGGMPRIEGPRELRKGPAERWAGWQGMGEDVGSVIADPRFVDGGKRDYRLRRDSPAYKLGFRAIDLKTVGNYKSAERRTWPRPEVKVVREPADYSAQAAEAAQPALRDYENYAVGDTERQADIGEEAGVCAVRVTDETASSGNHSLKFTNKPGRKYSYTPFVTYHPATEGGYLRAGFDLRWEQGAHFCYEWRDDPYQYNLGPRVEVDPEGWLSANGKRLGRATAGKWMRIDVVCGLGPQATGKYELAVRMPGAAPQVYKDLAYAEGFNTLNCVVIMSLANGPTTFYVDNLEFRRGLHP
jgi:hypothetical protein